MGEVNATTKRLTPAQRAFLAGYVGDLCDAENADLATADRADFVERVTGRDFDGQATHGNVRVAKNLHTLGLLSELDVHADIAGQPCIYLVFSATGAEAVFEVMRRG